MRGRSPLELPSIPRIVGLYSGSTWIPCVVTVAWSSDSLHIGSIPFRFTSNIGTVEASEITNIIFPYSLCSYGMAFTSNIPQDDIGVMV